MSKTREKLKKWCKENSVSMPEVTSLSFIPEGTMKHLLNEDSKVTAAKARIFNLTGLEIFKLSPDEEKEYIAETNDPTNEAYWDKKFSDTFINEWKETKMLPKLEYRLMESQSVKKPKNELSNYLKQVLFEQAVPAGKETVKTRQIKPRNRKDSLAGPIGDFTQYLEEQLSADDKSLLVFIQQNKKPLQKILGQLSILLDSDPVAAKKIIEETKKNF